MRVVFVCPYDEFALGVRSISAFLRSRGHEVYRVFLKTVYELWKWPQLAQSPDAADVGPRGFFAHPCRVTTREADLLVEKVAHLRPDLVGIPLSSNITNIGEFLTRRIRDEVGAPVIWGGIDPTLHPEKAIEVADFVCVGEGEFALAELLEALATGDRAPQVEGVWTRRPDGSIHRGALRPLIQDIDALPGFDWDESVEFTVVADKLFQGFPPPEFSRVHVEVPYMSQRGCPFECAYCCYSILKKRYKGQRYVRRRSVDLVIADLRRLVERFPRIEKFFFHDDVFTTHPKWIDEFAERYPREVGVPFTAYTHPSSCTRRTLEPLKRAGLIEARMGIQSGSERVLRDCYNRPTPRGRILESARLINELGIGLVVDLIGFNPLETERDRRETFDLLLRLPRPFRISVVNALSFYDGLPVTEMAIREGVKLSRPPGGGNKYEQEVTPEMRFWAALHALTMFDLDPEKVLVPLADDPYLRRNPEVLESLRRSLYRMNFVDGETAEKPKDRWIADLHERLVRLEERAHRPLARRLLDRLLGR